MSGYIEETQSSKESLLLKHKAETKQLQTTIQQLKKSVNKDKKRKKEVPDEIALLEKELMDKQKKELNDFGTQVEELEKVPRAEGICNGIKNIKIEEKQDENYIQISQQGKKVSKAEKRRQKKYGTSREKEAMIREEEERNKNSARNIEAEKLNKILRDKKFLMYEVNPDGNCMYAAIAHQLGCGVTVSNLRLKAGSFIRDHADEFAPFIMDSQTGEVVTPSQFEHYCNQLENTSTWGGQPELRALSQVLQKRIEVLQADASPIVFGEEFSIEKGVTLAYYRHYYGLGEHYNSVVPLKETS